MEERLKLTSRGRLLKREISRQPSQGRSRGQDLDRRRHLQLWHTELATLTTPRARLLEMDVQYLSQYKGTQMHKYTNCTSHSESYGCSGT